MIIFFAGLSYLGARTVESSNLSTTMLVDFLFAAGAMTGGIVAIVFSFSLFSVQSAADLYSSQFFETYSRERNEKLVFFSISIITLLFFAVGIAINWETVFLLNHPRAVACTSLFLVGLAFVLVDYQFEIVRGKVNPIKAINFLEEKAFNFLKIIDHDAKKMAKIISSKESHISEKTAIAAVYHNAMDIHLVNLDRQVENLFEIALKLSAREEVLSTSLGLKAVHNIVNRYMDMRKNDSVALPSSISFLATESDSQSFLSKIYERLNNTAEFFIGSKKTANALFIIEIYKSLGIKAGQIIFSEGRSGNPMFEQVRGYLSQCIQYGMDAKNHDVVLNGIRAYDDLATIAVYKGLKESVYSIQTDIPRFADYGIVQKQTYLVDACINIHLKIIGKIFVCESYAAQHAIEESVESIFKIIFSSSRFLGRDFSVHMTLSRPFDNLMATLSSVLDNYFKATSESTKKFYKENFFELLDVLRREIRNFSELFKNTGAIPINKIADLIQHIIDLLIFLVKNDEFSVEKSVLKKHLISYINLCGFVVDNSESFDASTLPFHTLFEVPAKTGIFLFKNHPDEDLIEDCIQTSYWMVKNAMDKDVKLSNSASIDLMMKLVYLGVLSLKYNKQELFENIVLKIYEFEYLYFEKYIKNLNLPSFINPRTAIGIPKEDDLCSASYHWLSDFSYSKHNHHSLMDDAEDRMYKMIETVDIEWFIFEVWRSFNVGSSIEEEIKSRYAKRDEVRNLVGILKKVQDVVARRDLK